MVIDFVYRGLDEKGLNFNGQKEGIHDLFHDFVTVYFWLNQMG